MEKLINLGSSSSGNCFYLELNRREDLPPVRLLLEAGFPYNEIVKKATNNGIDLTEINAVLITHGHRDHCMAAKELIRKRFKVFANEDVISRYNGDNANELQHDDVRMIAADTKVLAFEVEHDAPGSLGYVIQTSAETILFVNDCKYFKADLSKIKFDYIFIECNHDGQVMHFAYEDAKEKEDKAKEKHYERLFDSHMSLSHCIKHLLKFDLSKCKAIFLMHLSDRHANPNKFKYEVKDRTGINTFVCTKNGGLF